MKKIVITSLILAFALFTMGVECSTANLQEVKVCSDPDSDNVCQSDEGTFGPDVGEIFVTGEIHNAPEDTELTITWTYLGEEGDDAEEIDEVKLSTEDSSNTFYSSMEAPDGGWPGGDYEIVLDLGTDNSDPITKKFTVEGPAQPSGDDVISELMTCDNLGIADDFCPEDMDTFDPTTEEIFLTGILGEVPTGTEITITWRYLGGEGGAEQDIDSVVITATGETPAPLTSNYAATTEWPRGDYEIVIEIDGKKEGTIEFSVE